RGLERDQEVHVAPRKGLVPSRGAEQAQGLHAEAVEVCSVRSQNCQDIISPHRTPPGLYLDKSTPSAPWCRRRWRLHPAPIIPETLILEDIPMLEETLTEWLAEGRREGMRQILLQQLDQRFGTLPQQVRRQVEAVSSAQRLEELAKQVLVADS